MCVSAVCADLAPASPSQPLYSSPWTIPMTMGEMATPRSPLQSDSEGSTSSLELGSGVAGLALNGTPPPSSAQDAVKCRWQHCGLWLANLDQLALHVTLSHAAAGKNSMFYCGWEGCQRGHRGFNARYKMLVHVRTHTNERPHRCSRCEKSFSRAENLKIHARSHTGERPYTCPVPGCNKAYSNSSDRFKHTRTHAVDKPYVCKVEGCPKRYTDPSSLRKHVKTYRHFPSNSSSTPSDHDSPHGSPHGSPSPHGSDRDAPSPLSPHHRLSPLHSPSSDEDAVREGGRSAFRPVGGLAVDPVMERPPLPGECRGIPIKKAISARVRAVRHHDLLAASASSSTNTKSWAGGSVWVGQAQGSCGTTSPDALSLSMSPSSSPSPSPSSSSGGALPHADWTAQCGAPLYGSPINSPPWAWSSMLSLWAFPHAPAGFAVPPVGMGPMGALSPMAMNPMAMNPMAFEEPSPASPVHQTTAQAAPLDLSVSRH